MSKKRKAIPYDGIRRELIGAQKQMFAVRNRMNHICRKYPLLKKDFFYDTVSLLEEHLSDTIDDISDLVQYVTDAECTPRVFKESD